MDINFIGVINIIFNRSSFEMSGIVTLLLN